MSGRALRRGVSIARLGRLVSRYAAAPGLLDSLNALSLLSRGPDGASGAPSLTELALAHLRKEKGRGRAAPRLTVGELFERRVSSFGRAQARSAAAAKGPCIFERQISRRYTGTSRTRRSVSLFGRFRDPQNPRFVSCFSLMPSSLLPLLSRRTRR